MASQQGNSLSPRNMLYLKISDSLNEEEKRSLRALLVGEKIPKGKLEEKTPHEIFNMLEDDHRIGEGNLRFLKELLKKLNKTQLAKEAEDLENMESMAMPSTSKRKAPEEASSTKQPKMSRDDAEDSDDSASSGESGIGCSASASPQQDTDMPDYESGRNLMRSAEGAAGGSTFETLGDVRERIKQLETEVGAKRNEQPNNISKSAGMSKKYKEIARLHEILEQQTTGELNFELALLNTEARDEFQGICETGTLQQEIGKEVKQIMLSTSDDIDNVEPDVKVESTNFSPGRLATIKVTAEDVDLADGCKLDKDSAVRQLFKYLVDNSVKLNPILEYLNSCHVQVADITYGSIDFVCLCLTPESAVRLQQEYDSKKLQAQVQRVIASLSAILTEFGIRSISLAVDLKFADEVSKASGGTLQNYMHGSSDCGQDLKDTAEACSPGTDHTSTMEHQDDTDMSGLHSECQGGVEVKDLVEFGQFPSEEATGIKRSATHNKNHLQEDGMTEDQTDEQDEKEARTELKGSYREATAGQKESLNLQPQRTADGRLKLDLSYQGLTSIPEEVFDITDLEFLDVSNNELTSIPEAIGRLQKLRQLGTNGNKLTNLPQAIGSLQELTMLLIYDNQLTEVPPEVSSLSNLEVLDVSNNKLSTLPPGVEKPQKLRELYIYDNQLTEVPPVLCSLSNLEVLGVDRNPIQRLPDDVRRLTRLKTLSVPGCQFEEFPRQVLQLKTLEKLCAGRCKFDTVPDEVGTLQHLWFLSLEHNRLRTLPSTMSHLHNLREVHLWNNKFDTFPEVLCELPAMEKLDIRNNNITRLPTTLHRADKLTDLDVSGNPLTYPPQDVCEQGTGAIMTFMKQQAEKDEKILQAFNRLSVKVKQTQWKPLTRSLGLSNRAIDGIKASAPDDVPDQVYQTLVQWKLKAGEAATLPVLQQHLRELDFLQLAELLPQTPGTPDRKRLEPVVGAVGGQEMDELQNRYPSVTVDRRFPIVEFARLEEQSILGRGGFAYVMKARHLDWRQDVAVKCLWTRQLEGSEREVLYSEARKLNLGSRSDHVISLLGVCLDPNFAIVMPYMENGSLAGLLRDVDVPWALRWRMAHEISLGMTFLHCQNPQILHCDLKAENVLLDGDFHVKISDFGLSKWRTKSRVVTATSPAGGTITHAPPEFFLDINVDPTAAFDVYSFGVVLWELITRKEPYGNAVANSALIRLAVKSGQRPDMTLVPTDPPDVIAVSQLMQTCWSQNPEDRPTFQDCAAQLQLVKDRFGWEQIQQAIITVKRMKAAAPSKK